MKIVQLPSQIRLKLDMWEHKTTTHKPTTYFTTIKNKGNEVLKETPVSIIFLISAGLECKLDMSLSKC